MKWLRWLPRMFTRATAAADPAAAGAVSGAREGTDAIRPVGTCETCGNPISVRSRHAAYRGRVDCPCGHRNHVELLQVRTADGVESRHVTVTRHRTFETAVHDPDLRLGFRYGRCAHCGCGIRLLNAHVISQADSTGSVETFSYYCPTCHVHDDFRRGQLLGHDGEHVVDTLRFQIPPGIF